MHVEEFRDALILTGPTGSGKSQLALTLAERLGAEIICMDSMTLYRGMDIGTAKPSVDDRSRVPHHLLDVLDPWESASVAWWLERAAECCREIEGRGRRALFVGGTPLYLKALLCGLFDGPPADIELRKRLEAEAQVNGPDALHTRLAAVDPASAARLHVNDLRRVIRALEVYELTGRPMSDWQQQWNSPGARSANKGLDSQCICLSPLRDVLYDRINRRVVQMLDAGWMDEARRLRQLEHPLSREAGQAVGYREVFDNLDGLTTHEQMVDRIQTRTRQLAKRQLTWFRQLSECRPVTDELTIEQWALTMEPAPSPP